MRSDAQPQIMVPSFCEWHLHDLIVHKLHVPESGPWRATTVVAQILMFQRISKDDRVWKRAHGDAHNLSLVLAEIGCLACWDRETYRRAIRVMRKGLSHAAAVSKGEATDPDWDVPPSEGTKQ